MHSYASDQLVDWFRGVTSVPYGLILKNSSPRTDDQLRYGTNSGCFPSKFHIAERLRHFKSWDDVCTKSLLSKCSNCFPGSAKVISSSRVGGSLSGFSARAQKKFLRRYLQSMKRHHVAIFQKELWSLSLKRSTWQETKRSGFGRRLTAHESHFSFRH